MASQFPRWALLPKEETQALSFIRKSGHDGKGIRIAILDTGVDPAAAGLGSGKVVDLIDATGTGDVALKKAEPLSSDAAKEEILLPSPSGRHLQVSSKWANPTSTWRVGCKLAYELWPEDLVARRKKERRKEWDKAHHELVSSAQRDLAAFKDSKPASASKNAPKEETDDESKRKREDKEADERRLARKDLEDRLEALKELMSSYEDPGPVLEAVVWHDGKHWRSVVGGSEDDALGIPVSDKYRLDLSRSWPMTDYRVEKHWESFDKQSLLTYSVNILNDGEMLSICTLSGSHGTHVAGITAAHHPDSPELNGIAPGAELVSIKIGDRRVKGMETSQALLRAATAVLETKCDIVNMSFGESAGWNVEDKGAFVSALRELVRQDVIFVTSAGNAGPALTTIGAPANSAGLFSIGAYQTPAMQAAEYALLESVPGGPTTWSSRGPTADGDRGMACWAPGAAITSVPRYVLKHTQLMNGTSMASPSACGSIALVLSALRAEKIKWTPASIHKGIQFTSKDVEDPNGVGMLQVEKLHDWLVEHAERPEMHAEWTIQVSPQGRGEPMRGVYLRGYEETRALQQLQVNVIPRFKEDETDLAASLDLDLTMSSTQSWIRAPHYVSINGGGRLFNIQVDPSLLPAGYHTGEIRAHDDGGHPIFSIPVTVAKPEALAAPEISFSQKTSPGAMQRHYIAVPKGARWAEMTVTSKGNKIPIQYWLHGVQLIPLRRLDNAEESFVLALVDGEPQKKKIRVTGGLTLELVCTQGWNSIGQADVNVKLDFHGLEVVGGAEKLTVHGGDVLSEIAVSSQLRHEALTPQVSFEWLRSAVGPKDSAIRTLSERDRLPDGVNLFELKLTYSFKLTKKSMVRLVSAPQGNLYDNALALLGTVQDSRSRLYHFADVYAKEVELDKGEYTYRLQLVHKSLAVLEKAKSLPLKLDVKLDGASKGVGVTLQRDQVDAFMPDMAATFEGVKVQKGQRRAFLIDSRLTGDTKALYEDAKAGDLLLGKLLLVKGVDKAAVDVSLVLPPAPPKDEKDEPKPEPKKLIDHQVEMAKNLDEKEKVAYLAELTKSNPEHLPALIAHLEALKPKDKKKMTAESTAALDKAAAAILERINEDELSRFYGFKRPATTAEAKRETKKRDGEKVALIAALTARAETLLASITDHDESENISTSATSSDGFERVRSSSPRGFASSILELDKLYERLSRWTEPSFVQAKWEQMHGRPGSALLVVIKQLKELGAATSEQTKWTEAKDLEKELVAELKYDLWTRYLGKRKLVERPPSGDALF